MNEVIKSVPSNQTPMATTQMSAGHVAQQPDPYRVVKRALRGRYLLVSFLAIVGAAAGGYLGTRFPAPMYRSQGLVRIASSLPQVMQETDQNRPMQMFDTFMQSQKLLISSRRVLDLAMQDPIWKAGRQSPPEMQELIDNLQVEIKSRSEYIQVSVANANPAVAAATVTSIINAYSAMYNDQEKQLERQRSGVLEDRRVLLQGQADQLKAQIRQIALEYGTEKLDIFLEPAAARVGKLEDALADIRTAKATATSQPANNVNPENGESPAMALTADQIAQVDPVMRSYLDELRRQEQHLEVAILSKGGAHPEIVLARNTLDVLRKKISEYVENYQAFHQATNQNLGDGGIRTVMTAGQSLAALEAGEANLGKLLKETKQDMLALGAKRLEIQRLDNELKGINEELDRLTRRIEVLKAEGSLGGRLSIISTGEVPLNPEKSIIKRVAQGSMVGFVGLPGLFLLLLQPFSRKYRYSDETQSDSMPHIQLLGILPTLRNDLGDQEQVEAAAHCVHQIRITLSAKRSSDRTPVYMVTSAASSEGKTSLTMALGLSYTAARKRTLVIDCDWIGQGLTRKLGLKDKPGAYEFMESGNLHGLIHKTPMGLDVLASGNVDPIKACGFSTSTIRPLLDEARLDYEVILIDTGPILGSVEASSLAQVADGVIFTITRNQNRPVVESAINRLQFLNANVEGFVFNQAKSADFRRSWYSSSVRSTTAASPDRPVKRKEADIFTEFGPVVRSVAIQIPQQERVDGV